MVVLSLLVLILLQGHLIETKSVLPEAVAQAVSKSFNNTANLLHVVIDTDFEENRLSFLDTVQSILEKNWTFRIQIDINHEYGQACSDFNVWFIDSYKAFRRLFRWIRAYHSDSQLFYFIVLKTSNIQDEFYVMQKIFSDFLSIMLANLNIIVETKFGEVLFYTFYPYQEFGCRSTEPLDMFQFYNNTLDHNVIMYFPPKADNFHGCPLRIKTRNELVLHLINYDAPNKVRSAEMSLLELVMLKALSSTMNFTFEIYSSTDSTPDSSEALANGNIDVSLVSYANDPDLSHVFSISRTYFLSWLVIALLRRPDPLRTLIWLLVPFNSTTWTCTIGFLVITTGCIVMLRKSKTLVKIFHLRNSGGLEILSVTIGASVGHLPRKNYLRFAFIVLSLGALVLRSAYLGKLFDAYRGFTMVKPPLSVLELLADNYTIYAHNIYMPIIDELIGLENIRFEDLKSYQSNFEVLSDPHKKNAFVVSFIYIYSFYTAEQRKDIILKTVLRQQVCMFFPQHSIIAPRFNEIIMRMEEAGILHHVRKNYENIETNAQAVEEKVLEPIPLVLERFAFTFYLFGILNAISGLVFVAELMWKRFLDK